MKYDRCPVCGYYAFDGYECRDCGYTRRDGQFVIFTIVLTVLSVIAYAAGASGLI